MNAPADHRFLERLLRVEECLLTGQPVDADAVPEALAIIRAYRTGKSADEVLDFDDCQRGDRKEPHSIEDVVARLSTTVQRMELATEQLFHLADQRPAVAAPLLALSSNELSSRAAATEIGVDQQTIRNWLHKNPSLGCFRDGRWIVFRDMLESYKRARFPDATDQKLSR